MTTDGITRRHTLTGAAVLGVGIPFLAACGGDSESGGSDGGSDAEAPASGEKLGATSDVPVGGGKIYADQKVVVVQPTEGDFKAFSSICTHQGCPVTEISGDTIDCTCHGSKFSVSDGSVVTGPATSPLAEVDITVDGDTISTA